VHIGETEIATGVPEGQSLVVESKQVQYSSVEVMHMNSVLDGKVTKLISRPVDDARLYSAA
ncbi:uncharacterized protein METZ01_LOCUS420302, partial [marine metagenome]